MGRLPIEEGAQSLQRSRVLWFGVGAHVLERSHKAFFISKAEVADRRALATRDEAERSAWQEIAREYRTLAETFPQPEERQ